MKTDWGQSGIDLHKRVTTTTMQGGIDGTHAAGCPDVINKRSQIHNQILNVAPREVIKCIPLIDVPKSMTRFLCSLQAQSHCLVLSPFINNSLCLWTLRGMKSKAGGVLTAWWLCVGGVSASMDLLGYAWIAAFQKPFVVLFRLGDRPARSRSY